MSSKKRTFGLFTGVSFVAMAALGAPAPAQEADEGLEEIVVTATGRSAVIQDVPVAVTAVTAETIQNAGITDVRNLQALVPSYRVATGQSNSAGTAINIRGIGTGADNPGFEGAVGVFIDGVYRNRSGVALAELPEVQRIEVLRGPQGTLFGRNTSSGAVSVVTAKPEFATRVFGEATAGNFGFLGTKAGITGPLVEDKLAVRVEGGILARDGIIDDLNSGDSLNDRNRYFLRGQALWDLTDTFSVRLIADRSETDEQCCTAVYGKVGAAAGAINVLAALRGVRGIPVVNQEGYQNAFTPGRDYREAVEEQGISAEVNWDLGAVKATYIGSARDWSVLRNQDIDFNGSDRAYRDGFTQAFETVTHEVRFNGQAGPIDWLVGGFYLKEDLDLKDTIRFGADGARYADILTAGAASALGIPAALCNPATLTFGGCPTLYRSLPGQSTTPIPALGPVGAGGTPLFFQLALTGAVGAGPAAAYANAILNTAPTPGQGQVADRTATNTTGIALFTHNEISLSDQLTLTVGLRYNQEEKRLKANLNAVAPGCNAIQSPALAPITAAIFTPNPNPVVEAQFGQLRQLLLFACNPVVITVANGGYTDSREEEEWTGTGSLRFKPTDDLMIYAGYSRGYKSGGFNLDRSAFNINPSTTVRPSTRDWQFSPEFVDAYELGWKWTVLDGRAILNGALFRQNIEGYQQNAFNGFNFFNFNVPSVVSQGVELDGSVRANDFLTLAGGVSYIDAFYDGTVNVRGNAPINDGTPIAGNSKWNVTGAATWRFPIAGTGLAGLVYLDGRYASEYRTQTLGRDPTGFTDQKGFSVFNARVGLGGEDGKWGAELFVRNLTDQFYKLGALGVPEQTGNFAIYPSEPRTYGVTLRANF
jgi:outer membrane receptor protein involved in Fe transport